MQEFKDKIYKAYNTLDNKCTYTIDIDNVIDVKHSLTDELGSIWRDKYTFEQMCELYADISLYNAHRLNDIRRLNKEYNIQSMPCSPEFYKIFFVIQYLMDYKTVFSPNEEEARKIISEYCPKDIQEKDNLYIGEFLNWMIKNHKFDRTFIDY